MVRRLLTGRKAQPLTSSIRPGYRIVQHPRVFSKPLSCLSGIHKGLTTIMYLGVPHLYCTKCGGIMSKGIHEGTVTKHDLRKQDEKRIRKPRTNEEILEESWRKLGELRRHNTDKSIRKMVRRRLLQDY